MRPVTAIALFCEDVREEKTGQVSIVGIMPDNALVTKIPGSFPRLGVYVRIHLDPDFEPGRISIIIRGPGSQSEELTTIEESLVAKARGDAKAANNPIAGLVTTLVTGNLPILEAGRIVAIIKIGTEEYVGGMLNVKLKSDS